jgi:hypothetical protein
MMAAAQPAPAPPPEPVAQPVNMLSVSEEQLTQIVNAKVSQIMTEQGQHELAARPDKITVPGTADAQAQPGRVQWRPRVTGDQFVNFAVVASVEMCPPYQGDCDNEDQPNAKLGDICALPVYEFNSARYCISKEDPSKWGWAAESVDSPVDFNAQGSVATVVNAQLSDLTQNLEAPRIEMPSTQGLADSLVQNAMTKAASEVKLKGMENGAEEAEEIIRLGAEQNARLARLATELRDQSAKDSGEEIERMKLKQTLLRDKESDDSNEEILRMKGKATDLRDKEADASLQEVLREKVKATSGRDDEFEASSKEVVRERMAATKMRDASFGMSSNEVVREQQSANKLRNDDVDRSTAESLRERKDATKARDALIEEGRNEVRHERERAKKYTETLIQEAKEALVNERQSATTERDRQNDETRKEVQRWALKATKERDAQQERATRIRDCQTLGGQHCEQMEMNIENGALDDKGDDDDDDELQR